MAIAKAFRAIPFFVGIAQLADRIYTPVRHLNVGANIGLQHLSDFHRFMDRNTKLQQQTANIIVACRMFWNCICFSSPRCVA